MYRSVAWKFLQTGKDFDEALISSLAKTMVIEFKPEASVNRVFVDGAVSGRINGTVSGIMRANIDGEVNLTLISGNVTEEIPTPPPALPPQEPAASEAKEETGHEKE